MEGCYQRSDDEIILAWTSLPLGVTGNTPDSGSGESWFEPRRGNSKRDATMSRVALLVFLGHATVLQQFTDRPSWNLTASLLTADLPVPELHRRAHHLEHAGLGGLR